MLHSTEDFVVTQEPVLFSYEMNVSGKVELDLQKRVRIFTDDSAASVPRAVCLLAASQGITSPISSPGCFCWPHLPWECIKALLIPSAKWNQESNVQAQLTGDLISHPRSTGRLTARGDCRDEAAPGSTVTCWGFHTLGFLVPDLIPEILESIRIFWSKLGHSTILTSISLRFCP